MNEMSVLPLKAIEIAQCKVWPPPMSNIGLAWVLTETKTLEPSSRLPNIEEDV